MIVTGRAQASPGRRGPSPPQIAGHLVERPLRRRQADATNEAAWVERSEAFEQQRQKDAALVGAQGVDLVDDEVSDAAQHVAAARVSSRCSDSGVVISTCGGRADLPLPFGLWRCRRCGRALEGRQASSAGRAASATPSSGT